MTEHIDHQEKKPDDSTLKKVAQSIRVKANKFREWSEVKEDIDEYANETRRNFSNSVLKLLELGLQKWKETRDSE